MLKRFIKWLNPPSPKELGRAERDALPMRDFDPFNESYSWEDWHKEVKRDYPVRYFLTDTVPHHFAVKVAIPLRNFKWWVIDLFRRPHMLDMRDKEYKGGYIDPCQAVLHANFKLLEMYINEKPYNLRDEYTDKEIDKQGLRMQQDHYDEAHALYHYWTTTRKEIHDDNHMLYLAQKAAGEAGDRKEYEYLKKVWLEGNREEEEKEQEMLERLIKIRRGFWT